MSYCNVWIDSPFYSLIILRFSTKKVVFVINDKILFPRKWQM